MTRTSRGVALGLVVGLVAPTFASASVLCRVRKRDLVVRDVCKPREETITVDRQRELGMGGAQGPAGAPGPRVGDLRVLDAVGHEVGVVTGTNTYYGSAGVVAPLTLPGSAGPEFFVFDVATNGLLEFSSCDDLAQTYRTPDCQGEQLMECDGYAACGPDDGAFFARQLGRDGATGICYPGKASEFEQGDFYRRFRARGSSPSDVQAFCQARGGTLVEPPALCVPSKPIYCAACCQPRPNVGVVPLHHTDASIIGTPPFRLAR